MTGEIGETGARGSRGKDGGWMLFVITMLVVIGLAWQNDKRSCERQHGVRGAARIFADTAFEARTAAARLDLKRGDLEAWTVDHTAALNYARSRAEARPLDCGGAFPDTR